MSNTGPIVPPPGNSARPVFFLIAVSFGVMVVGFPIFMYVVGLSTATIVWITLFIAAICAGVLWLTVHLGRNLQRDADRLDAGEVWGEWTVPLQQHRRFVDGERRTTNRTALGFAAGGTALGVVLARLEQDWLLGAIMTGVFLLAAGVIYFLAGPPRSAHSDDARHVRIGPAGVHVLGRYLPFKTTMTRLHAVDIADGDPPVMRLTVQAGRQIDQIRVPVAPDQLDQAEAVADRLRQMHEL